MTNNVGEKLANTHRPKFFRDYIGQGNNAGGPVDVLKNMVARNLHKQIGNVGIFGSSGSGKTSLAMLYAKATLCYNRKPGEYEPCGECPVCLGEDLNNISHLTISSSSEAREPLKNLIEISRQYPINVGQREDQFRRFCILDEIQNASPELLATLYEPLEFPPTTTTWILISMDIDKLKRLNAPAYEALVSRGGEFNLAKFSDIDIANNLVGKENINYDAALAIATISEGNMRRAWSNLGMMLALAPAEELTEEMVLSPRTGGATKESRLMMWEALAKGDGTKVREIIEGWTNQASDIKLVGNLLQKDLLDNLKEVNSDIQNLLSSIGRWYNGLSYPLSTVIMRHLGSQVIPISKGKERKEKRALAERKLTVKQLVSQETAKALLKLKGVPTILVVTDFNDLVIHCNADSDN